MPPEIQKYRMLALDVDGTIADREYRVPDAIKAAINDAVAAGAVVSIVTGRMRRSALRYAEECGTNGPTISNQGSVITGSDMATVLHSECLGNDAAARALSEMRRAKSYVTVFSGDDISVESENEWALQYAVRMRTELRTDRQLDEVVASCANVVMAVDDPDRIARLATVLRSSLNSSATVNHSLPRFCEVSSPTASKRHALERVCADLAIEPHEVIAVGDGEADAPMIEWAGLGVAAGAAHHSAAGVADMQIEGPEQNGVADLIQILLNQGKLGG